MNEIIFIYLVLGLLPVLFLRITRGEKLPIGMYVLITLGWPVIIILLLAILVDFLFSIEL